MLTLYVIVALSKDRRARKLNLVRKDSTLGGCPVGLFGDIACDPLGADVGVQLHAMGCTVRRLSRDRHVGKRKRLSESVAWNDRRQERIDELYGPGSECKLACRRGKRQSCLRR